MYMNVTTTITIVSSYWNWSISIYIDSVSVDKLDNLINRGRYHRSSVQLNLDQSSWIDHAVDILKITKVGYAWIWAHDVKFCTNYSFLINDISRNVSSHPSILTQLAIGHASEVVSSHASRFLHLSQYCLIEGLLAASFSPSVNLAQVLLLPLLPLSTWC